MSEVWEVSPVVAWSTIPKEVVVVGRPTFPIMGCRAARVYITAVWAILWAPLMPPRRMLRSVEAPQSLGLSSAKLLRSEERRVGKEGRVCVAASERTKKRDE